VTWTIDYSLNYSFIHWTYIAPLQDNLLRGAPNSTQVIRNSLQKLV